MLQTNISEGQSLVDVCLQELGSVSALFDLATANGLAITDALLPGQVLVIPASLAGRADIVAYFQQRGHRINTNNSAVPTNAAHPDGIFDGTYADQFN